MCIRSGHYSPCGIEESGLSPPLIDLREHVGVALARQPVAGECKRRDQGDERGKRTRGEAEIAHKIGRDLLAGFGARLETDGIERDAGEKTPKPCRSLSGKREPREEEAFAPDMKAVLVLIGGVGHHRLRADRAADQPRAAGKGIDE